MKALVAVLLLVIVGLSATIYVQSRTNASLNEQIVALNREIRPLRTSEELMISLSKRNKEWENEVRPIYVGACQALGYHPDQCKGMMVDPSEFRASARAWAAAIRR